MQKLPERLQKKIDERVASNSLRKLSVEENLVDFSSNDYLGFGSSQEIYDRANQILEDKNLKKNGATGSRLLTGNHFLFDETEKQIAAFHKSEAALIFNSGYDANVGFFSSVPQRGDLIFYDELSHASIRDGLRMSSAKYFKFPHNNIEKLKSLCQVESSRNLNENSEIYIVTESVFSMDGDSPDLLAFSVFCEENKFHLIVDEAHALGVCGKNGEGLLQELGIESKVFARLVTFGKGLGCHGAAILGSFALREYLLNFARSFIYTTALPPHSVTTIQAGYEAMITSKSIKKLHCNIESFLSYIKKYNLSEKFIPSNSAIQSCILSGNERVKSISVNLKDEGFDVKPILSPTVAEGKERLRICLHSFNLEVEIELLVKVLAIFVR